MTKLRKRLRVIVVAERDAAINLPDESCAMELRA